jgi:hypothetical protein
MKANCGRVNACLGCPDCRPRGEPGFGPDTPLHEIAAELDQLVDSRDARINELEIELRAAATVLQGIATDWQLARARLAANRAFSYLNMMKR